MECALDTASLIATCRRLLTTLETEEARAAVDACDVWLKQQQRSMRLARLNSPLPPEVLHVILRTVNPEDRKKTYLACSLMNKSWRQREIPVGPMMGGLRMINLKKPGYRVGSLLTLFEIAPNLVSLRVHLKWANYEDGKDIIDGSGEEGELGQDGRRVRVWKDRSEQIWKQGFARLKALNILLEVPHDVMMGMADGLGPNLESLHVRVVPSPGSEGAMDSIIHKVTANCPNLKDVALDIFEEDMGLIRHFLESRPPLLYLSLGLLPSDDALSDEILKQIASACPNLIYLKIHCGTLTGTNLRHLAKGPFLRGCELIGILDTDTAQSDLYEFLKQRGRKLEGFSLIYHYWPDVDRNPGDGVMDHLIDCAPNLQQLNITHVTEEGVLRLLDASGKLKRLYLERELLENDRVHAAAAERNVFVPHPDNFESVPHPLSVRAFPSYVEVMKDSWIGEDLDEAGGEE
ncbi:hypothetical protein HK104_005031 [Borealophlyctis nickersoniae]|nr:hypothetical protein HK104_005031 [Borealophlyctis nickersoniae]